MKMVFLGVCLCAALGVAVSAGWSSSDSATRSASGPPAACDTSIRGFNTWDKATVRAINGAQTVRKTILGFVNGALNNASAAKAAGLAASYNKATNAQAANVAVVTLTGKVYTTQRPRCVLTPAVVAPCQTLVQRADSLTAPNRKRALPILTGTDKVSTSFAALVRTQNASGQQLETLLDRLIALGKANTVYNTKRSPLVAQYNKAVSLCYAA